MGALEIHQFMCRSDNYGVLVHAPETGETASIDAPNADAIRQALADKGWKLTHIFTTHHHGDHVEGHRALKRETGCRITGPKREDAKIPELDDAVGDEDAFTFAGHAVQILETPGHTLGHIAYVLPDDRLAFVGDTLFAMGCGRIFEGTADMMWGSLCKLMALPANTTVYCGHEYTLANARFALTVEPDNAELAARVKEVEALRDKGLATLPTTMAQELATNPFLRADTAGIRQTLAMPDAPAGEVFAEIRKRKDNA